MSGFALSARKCLSWLVAGAALAFWSNCHETSVGDRPGIEVVTGERGVKTVGTEKSPGRSGSRDGMLDRPLNDIDGKDGSLTILFLGDGRGDLPGVSKE